MNLKKNIWFVFYFLILFGFIYLVTSIFSTWNNLQSHSRDELAFLNKIFSASVTSTFDQQEIMLEILGQDLVSLPPDTFSKDAALILDKLHAQQKSVVGFGFSNLNGDFIATTSNVDTANMPNLKQSQPSSFSFDQALQQDVMVLGRTYFLDAANSWIMPIRKAIRDKEGKTLGVMSAGLKPEQLIPRLNAISKSSLSSDEDAFLYQSSLLHDNSFFYAYKSRDLNAHLDASHIKTPVPTEWLLIHTEMMEKQTGLNLRDIKTQPISLEYTAPDTDGVSNIYSVLYLPKYRLWSMTSLPRIYLVEKIKKTISSYLIVFLIVVLIIFLLFRNIYNAEHKNRKQLRNQANHDFLTGLHNRLFLEYAEPKWIYEGAEPFSVIFMDLDNFKNINDSYGHSYGDEILIEVSSRLRRYFQTKPLICRQGGDEFIILCNIVDVEQLESMAKKLLEAISQPYHIEEYKFTIGASIGICRYPDDGNTFDSLFSAADTAMYEAKNKNNNYFVFTREMHDNIIKKSNIEQALHGALQSNEFFMVYQPQITKSGQLYGVESLIRWVNRDLGFVAPDQFISIAEDSGLILELGHFILRQSIKDIANLSHGDLHPDIRLSINISVRQFLQEGFLGQVKSALDEFDFPADHLTLEITESIFIDDFEYITPLFNSFLELGVKFSLDDFGTGFSSLSMLRNLPIYELKIDKSFIDHITDEPQDRAMVLNILNIASNLNLLVVAEGIETEDQAVLLNDFSCDVKQGYLYSRPIKFEELTEYISQFNNGQ